VTPPYEDLTALRRDADTLDRLAAGTEVPADSERELLVDLLAALRDEAREPLPERVSTTSRTRQRPRLGGAHAADRSWRGRKRAVAGATVALVSMSLTGVAAAVGGDDFLAPIRAVIAQVTGDGGEGSSSEETTTVHDSVASLLEQSRQAIAENNRAEAVDLLGRARELAESLEGPAADEAAAEVASVEEDVTGPDGSEGESSTGATESDGQTDGGSTSDGGEEAATPGGVGSGGSSGTGSTDASGGTGTSVAPGQSQPPGQGDEPGQSSAPGRAGRPGAVVDPPRSRPERPTDVSVDVDGSSGDGGSEDPAASGIGDQVPATTPGASGVASYARGAPAHRPSADRDVGGGAPADRPGARPGAGGQGGG
jgi:hypothetical protein